ncbi:MAG TPA: SdiA-regulated domain-containing protein [Rubricoccaceae bacterium]|jgi:uncharacterized protein YjiK|nr:SdiA-regulated domain-containing protein [Rubricoccaceae bacterium]
MRPLLLALAVSLALPLTACGQDAAPDVTSAVLAGTAARDGTASTSASYAFDQPVAVFTLPEELREISALTVLDERHLGAVQDEEGALFVLDVETGEVVTVVPFGPAGDYEGVELAAGRLFVLRSDGALLELEGWEGGPSRVQTYALDLPTDCDAEGLGYDGAAGSLLIACKEDGGVGVNGQKAIFALHLDDWALGRQPAYVLDARGVNGDREVKPSAVAVHPVTGQVAVLSSTLPVLVALAPGGAVAHAWDLSAAGFEQPEGLAFLPNGDLFIASEGDDGPPLLKRFEYLEAP